MTAPTVLAEADELFATDPEWHIPGLADRYDTKKKAGDSDGYNTSDEIEV